MAAEVMLVGVAKLALEEGVRFLYEQAGKVLDAWRARRRDPAAPPPVVVAAPAEVTVGTVQPSTTTPDPATVVALEDLRADAERIANGQLAADDPAARATIAALREILEAALGTSITFAGEAARPVRVSDINVVVNDVRGRLAGVRLATGQGADVTKVYIKAHDVEAGGELVGVEIGGGSKRDPAEQAKPGRLIKILFLAANPIDTVPLRLDQEMRAIDEALRKAKYRDRFEIEQQWAVRIGDLHDAFLRFEPDIVHFSGHGTEASEIVLEDESGTGRAVPQDALGRLFAVLRDNIRCVVLNACYSEPQAQAIAEHIDCVVGMTTAVGDAAAIEFATAFYRALGYGRDVQTAFDLGTNLIALEGLPDADTPHLVANRVKAADVSFVASETGERDTDGLMTPGLIHSPPAGWVSNATRNNWRYKVVAFDLDGTILRGEDFVFSWEAIWKALGFAPTVQRELKREYRRRSGGNASREERIAAYKDWCEQACDRFRRRGLTRAQLRSLSMQLHLTGNCREALARLRQEGLAIAIVSGGVNVFLEDAFTDFREYVDFVFINQLTFNDEDKLEGVVATAYDFEGKAEALELVCRQVGCAPSEAAFIGDHFNDEAAMLRAGLAIAYPAHALVVSDTSGLEIREDDLLTILSRVLVE